MPEPKTLLEANSKLQILKAFTEAKDVYLEEVEKIFEVKSTSQPPNLRQSIVSLKGPQSMDSPLRGSWVERNFLMRHSRRSDQSIFRFFLKLAQKERRRDK